MPLWATTICSRENDIFGYLGYTGSLEGKKLEELSRATNQIPSSTAGENIKAVIWLVAMQLVKAAGWCMETNK